MEAAAIRIGRRVARACIAASAAVVVAAMVQGPAMPTPDALRRLYAGPTASWPRPELRPGAAFEEFAPLPPRTAPDPAQAAWIALGARLFDDPLLSGSRQIACATCHARELGFGDGLARSFGHDRTRGQRNAQSLFVAAWMMPLFWDGRAATLEEQVLHPVTDRVEMAADLGTVERRVRGDAAYRRDFAALIGRKRIDRRVIARALAAFVGSIRPRTGTYARFLAGDTRALDDRQLAGLHLFRTRAGCANCHSGPLLSDRRFHNLGLSFFGRARQDLGRYLVTGRAEDVGAFRTPSLLGVSRTGPYMHNGLFPTLAGTVNFYAAGGGRDTRAAAIGSSAPSPRPDPLLAPVALTRAEREALVSFLETL